MSSPLIDYTRPEKYGLVRVECSGCGTPLGWHVRNVSGLYCDSCKQLMRGRGWETGMECSGGVCVMPLAGGPAAHE